MPSPNPCPLSHPIPCLSPAPPASAVLSEEQIGMLRESLKKVDGTGESAALDYTKFSE